MRLPEASFLKHHTIPADDGELIHYYVGGRCDPGAPLLVFLHGLGSNHTRWHRLVRQSFFQEQCRVIVLDLRGHGESHARRMVDQQGIGRDVVTLLTHEHAGPAILVGHCLGANLAVRVWQCSPERVGGMIFIEPFVASAIHLELRLLRWTLLPLLWCVSGIMVLVNGIGIKRRRFRMVDYEAYDEWVRHRLTSVWATVRYMGPWVDLQTMPVRSYLQAFQTLFTYRPPWETIRCPTLAIYGKEAELAGSDGHRPLLANPHVQATYLAASHFVLTDNMPGVATAIEAFVKDVHSPVR